VGLSSVNLFKDPAYFRAPSAAGSDGCDAAASSAPPGNHRRNCRTGAGDLARLQAENPQAGSGACWNPDSLPPAVLTAYVSPGSGLMASAAGGELTRRRPPRHPGDPPTPRGGPYPGILGRGPGQRAALEPGSRSEVRGTPIDSQLGAPGQPAPAVPGGLAVAATSSSCTR
jgi:hypothetical protein